MFKYVPRIESAGSWDNSVSNLGGDFHTNKQIGFFSVLIYNALNISRYNPHKGSALISSIFKRVRVLRVKSLRISGLVKGVK